MFPGKIGFGREPLAAYAADAGRSRGRLFPETPSPTRTEFQRDRDRIVHSTAFRRLKDKTQVFLYRRGRPLPNPADPHARGRPDRAGNRAGAEAG